jgi:hypothetical protein
MLQLKSNGKGFSWIVRLNSIAVLQLDSPMEIGHGDGDE